MTYRKISTVELDRIQDHQDGAMNDTGQILTFSQNVDSAGRLGQATYTAGAAISLGWKPAGTKDHHPDQNIPTVDGRFRLPVGTTITNQDRIRLTAVKGITLPASLTFQITGEIKRRHTAILVNVVQVQDGT